MRKILTALGLCLALVTVAFGANLPLFSSPSTNEPSQINATLNQLIQSINSLISPATMQVYPNVLDNGAMQVQQRGTGIRTCGDNTAPTMTAYSADRWVCDANVAVGAGRTQVITATPSPPAGFAASLKVYRTSGALTQPVCAMQEVTTANSIGLQGQTVAFSFYAQALAGLAADNGNVINATIITGTGTNEGFGTLTASPAITPAWTGLATVATQSFTITTGWVRYSLTTTLPATETEIGVLLCFTPTATGAGVTDGFAFVGAQLEQGAAPSNYQFKSIVQEMLVAQHFYFRFSEVNGAPLNGYCQAITANTNTCTLALPVPMRAAPTITITTAGTFKVNIAGTLTTIATPTAGACAPTACLVTAANTNTAGQVEQLTGAVGATGVWEVSIDF